MNLAHLIFFGFWPGGTPPDVATTAQGGFLVGGVTSRGIQAGAVVSRGIQAGTVVSRGIQAGTVSSD